MRLNKILKIKTTVFLCLFLLATQVIAQENTHSSQMEKGTYQINVQKVKVLNQYLLGIYTDVSDARGVIYRIKSGTLKSLKINNEEQVYWYLDQQEAYLQKIDDLKGKFSQHFTPNFTNFKFINPLFFRLHRTANRIQIFHPKRSYSLEFLEKAKKRTLSNNEAKVFHQSLSGGNSAKKNDKIISLIAKLKGIKPGQVFGKDQNTKSRFAARRYLSFISSQNRTDVDKKLPVLSKITKAALFKAEIIQRTSDSDVSLRFKPHDIDIFPKHAISDFQAKAQFENAVNFMEKVTGDNSKTVIVIPIPKSVSTDNSITINMNIANSDNHLIHYQNSHHFSKNDFEWLNQTILKEKNNELMQLDDEFQNLFTANKFQALIAKTEAMLPEGQQDQIPIPLLSNWLYLTAKSWEQLGAIKKALKWYKKTIKIGPYSSQYQNAIQRIITLNNSDLYKE